jgi:hypothetical protein
MVYREKKHLHSLGYYAETVCHFLLQSRADSGVDDHWLPSSPMKYVNLFRELQISTLAHTEVPLICLCWKFVETTFLEDEFWCISALEIVRNKNVVKSFIFVLGIIHFSTKRN